MGRSTPRIGSLTLLAVASIPGFQPLAVAQDAASDSVESLFQTLYTFQGGKTGLAPMA
jgi:hypothetical protein